MLRRILYFIAYKFYALGQVQYEIRNTKLRRLELEKIATIHPSTIIWNESNITNHQQNREIIKIGKECNLRCEIIIMKHGGKLEIGDHCFIGAESKLWSGKSISIGNRVLISHNVNIHDNISHSLDSKERHLDYLHIFSKGLQEFNDLREENIVIEDDVWIGFNCTIFKGVKIGKGSIIGACTVITKDVPPYSIVINENSQKIIKYTT